MKALISAILILGMAALMGCSTNPPLEAGAHLQTPPPYKSTVNLEKPKPTLGSLFDPGNNDFYTDLRAAKVGDLVIVEVVENSKAKSKNDSKAERTNDFEASIPYFFGYEGSFRRDGDDSKSDPLIQAGFKSSHDATGEIKREDTVTASIGCTVIEVLPNGNLVIRGSREVEVAGETQTITLQGLVRPVDITTDNTVLSTQLADAKIYYTGRGILTDKNSPGWLARLLDHVWPF